MVDKKNLVIKVKYPSAGKKIESSPNIITTWNVKRILIALASLLLFISLLLYLALKSDEAPVNTSENKVLEVPKAVDQNIKPVATNQTPHVSSALFSMGNMFFTATKICQDITISNNIY